MTGSRRWLEYGRVFEALDRARPDLVVHGGCYVGVRPLKPMGADYWAHRWCVYTECDERIFRAHWTTDGRRAGPLRNQRMIEAYPQAEVLAFPQDGGRGTQDCMRRASKLGMLVVVP